MHSCTFCKKEYTQAGNRARHEQKCPQRDNPLELQCPKCVRLFPSFKTLLHHLHKCYEQSDRLACPLCAKVFVYKSSKSTHVHLCYQDHSKRMIYIPSTGIETYFYCMTDAFFCKCVRKSKNPEELIVHFTREISKHEGYQQVALTCTRSKTCMVIQNGTWVPADRAATMRIITKRILRAMMHFLCNSEYIGMSPGCRQTWQDVHERYLSYVIVDDNRHIKPEQRKWAIRVFTNLVQKEFVNMTHACFGKRCNALCLPRNITAWVQPSEEEEDDA